MNPFGFLFVRSRREQHLAQYVLREYRRGRGLSDILADRYVVNRTSDEERARLLDRPEVLEAIGEQTVATMKKGLDATWPRAGEPA